MFQDNIALFAGNGQLMTPPPSDEFPEDDTVLPRITTVIRPATTVVIRVRRCTNPRFR